MKPDVIELNNLLQRIPIETFRSLKYAQRAKPFAYFFIEFVSKSGFDGEVVETLIAFSVSGYKLKKTAALLNLDLPTLRKKMFRAFSKLEKRERAYFALLRKNTDSIEHPLKDTFLAFLKPINEHTELGDEIVHILTSKGITSLWHLNKYTYSKLINLEILTPKQLATLSYYLNRNRYNEILNWEVLANWFEQSNRRFIGVTDHDMNY